MYNDIVKALYVLRMLGRLSEGRGLYVSGISCQEGLCLDGNVANSMGSKGNFKCTEQFEDSTIQHHCRCPFEQWNISG